MDKLAMAQENLDARPVRVQHEPDAPSETFSFYSVGPLELKALDDVVCSLPAKTRFEKRTHPHLMLLEELL